MHHSPSSSLSPESSTSTSLCPGKDRGSKVVWKHFWNIYFALLDCFLGGEFCTRSSLSSSGFLFNNDEEFTLCIVLSFANTSFLGGVFVREKSRVFLWLFWNGVSITSLILLVESELLVSVGFSELLFALLRLVKDFLLNDLMLFLVLVVRLTGAFLGTTFGLVDTVLWDAVSDKGFKVARTKLHSTDDDLQTNTTGLEIKLFVEIKSTYLKIIK